MKYPKSPVMKKISFFVVLIFLLACQNQVEDIQSITNLSTDLKAHNMKIIPEVPTQSDEIKLVIFDDCTYNVLSGVTRTGNTIDIRKQFNSMMKWPCMMKNDTILIGKLPQGSYNVNYTLIDISQSAPQNISVNFSFKLDVGR
jgi:hypothetical protein